MSSASPDITSICQIQLLHRATLETLQYFLESASYSGQHIERLGLGNLLPSFFMFSLNLSLISAESQRRLLTTPCQHRTVTCSKECAHDVPFAHVFDTGGVQPSRATCQKPQESHRKADDHQNVRTMTIIEMLFWASLVYIYIYKYNYIKWTYLLNSWVSSWIGTSVQAWTKPTRPPACSKQPRSLGSLGPAPEHQVTQPVRLI